jgi:hypothetical protein
MHDDAERFLDVKGGTFQVTEENMHGEPYTVHQSIITVMESRKRTSATCRAKENVKFILVFGRKNIRDETTCRNEAYVGVLY